MFDYLSCMYLISIGLKYTAPLPILPTKDYPEVASGLKWPKCVATLPGSCNNPAIQSKHNVWLHFSFLQSIFKPYSIIYRGNNEVHSCKLIIAGILTGCGRSTRKVEKTSPDKTMRLVAYSKDGIVHFKIISAKKENVIFETKTRASAYHRWNMEWKDNKKILLDSSDIGSYFWIYKNGFWKELSDSDNKPEKKFMEKK